MKTKGISFWEQHLEHFVVAAAVLVLIGFTAVQFIGNPNSVDVPGKGKVGPGQIDHLLRDTATTISDKMKGPALEVPPPAPVLKDFQTRLTSGISPTREAPVMAYNLTPGGSFVLPPANRPFVIPSINAPYDLLAKQYFDTLLPEDVSKHEDLKNSLPASAPYDITWITAAATFDAGAVRRQFGQAGPKGEAPLPLKWYNDRVDFVDLKIEREELVNGNWIKSTLLEPIPGQLTVRPKLNGRVDSATRDEILSLTWSQSGKNDIVQPEFYTGKAAAWAPPTRESKADDKAVDPEEQAIIDLKRERDRIKSERDRIAKALKDAGCPETEPNPPPKPTKPSPKPSPTTPPGGRPAPGSGGVGEGSGSGGSRGLRDVNPVDKNQETKCKALRSKLKILNDQLNGIEAELAKKAANDAPPPVEAQPEEQADTLMVWGHDIHVQPGKTYRYRFTIEIYNPLFARKNDLMPEQQAMAEKFTLVSKTSEWSAPITANPPLRLFITQARTTSVSSNAPATSASSALAEVYRFYDGRWWSERFSIQPGDRIGGPKGSTKPSDKSASIDYGTDWFLLDIIPDMAADNAEVAQGLGAAALLQSISEDGLSQYRSPREDSGSSDRSFLRQKVKSAEVGGAAVANAG